MLFWLLLTDMVMNDIGSTEADLELQIPQEDKNIKFLEDYAIIGNIRIHFNLMFF